MKPWVLLLIMLIYGVVMLLPVLGGIRDRHLTGCMARGEGALPWPEISGVTDPIFRTTLQRIRTLLRAGPSRKD